MSEQLSADGALLLLVRHGSTEKNEDNEFRGQSNDDSSSLDKKGLRQARVAGLFLRKLPINFGLVVSSDLDRSLHTAAIIGQLLGIKDIHTDKRLRALDVGDFTGKDKDNHDIDSYLENPSEPFPNGESVEDFRERQKSFFDDLADWIKDNPDVKPIVVGHLSNVVYWQDLNKALKGYLQDYATDKEDLVHPGGIVAIYPDDQVVPLLGENKKATLSDKGEE